MSSRFNKPKGLRYQILLDEESSDQFELLREFSGFRKLRKNDMAIKAIETLFEQEIKIKPDLKLEWQKIIKSKERKVVSINKEKGDM